MPRPVKRLLGALRAKRLAVRYGWQRARRGYSDRDVWNLHEYLEGIIVGATRQLRDGPTCSYPLGLGPEQWNKILTEIADGFDGIAKPWHHTEEQIKAFDKAFRHLHKWWFGLWD